MSRRSTLTDTRLSRAASPMDVSMEGASPSKALAAKAISPTVALNGSDSGKENEEVTGRDTRKVQSTAAASPLTTEGNQEAEVLPTRGLRNRGSPISYSESNPRPVAKRKDESPAEVEASAPKKRRMTDGTPSASTSATRTRESKDAREAREAKEAKEAKEIQKKEKELEALASLITPTPLALVKEERGGYVKAGMYSSASRNDGTSNSKRKREIAEEFKIGMPLYWGMTLLEKQKEFEPPFDLIHMYETIGLTGDSAIDEIRVSMNRNPPSKFEKIRKNIFVDRRPNNEAAPECLCVKPKDGSMGCVDDECLNRATFYECDPKTCPCGDKCANQRFQKGERVQELQVCQTLRRGHGLKTLVDIPEGTLIIEYRGEVINEDTCLDRMAENPNAVYFLEYDTGEFVDACKKGTEARFINHSCDPNCNIEKWHIGGEFCIGVFAAHDIKAGTELTYDYRFESIGDDMMKCGCGSARCRGLIGENRKVGDEDEPSDRRRSSSSHARGASGKANSNNKAQPPVKKKVVNLERQFWLAKQKKDRLVMSLKETEMNKGWMLLARIFLLRNLKRAEKALSPVDQKQPSTFNLPTYSSTSGPSSKSNYKARRTWAQIFNVPPHDPDMPPPDLSLSKEAKRKLNRMK